MLIVIEGPDRTGKTTLARRLSENLSRPEYEVPVVHAGPPTRGAIEEYETTLDGFDPRTSSLILDRWHVGEYVWPVIFGRRSDFLAEVRRHVEMFMHSRGALVVYANRDPEKLAPDLVANNEPLKPEDIERTNSLFYQARVFAERYAEFWDYERCGVDQLSRIIRSASALNREVAPVWDVVGPGWVGNPRPKLLLVGDELGPEKEGRTPPHDVPFAPYRDTSGYWLMGYLNEVWRDVALVNSKTGREGEVRDMRAVWKAFGRPTLCALGVNAASVLAKQRLTHRQFPHPQYWRRFHHGEAAEYSRRLREVLWGELSSSATR